MAVFAELNCGAVGGGGGAASSAANQGRLWAGVERVRRVDASARTFVFDVVKLILTVGNLKGLEIGVWGLNEDNVMTSGSDE